MIDNIEKIKALLKEFDSNSTKDYEFWAWKINSIFTGFMPAKYFVINEDGKTLEDAYHEMT
jgi:hypothetical protein